ncbi:Na+/H+ antiporter [Heyndrickxia oleronia]|uniref:Na+/H+ antiporter n=1 Tax=Heyndrickxia oleronia TaxID=38875 RepID=UPI001C0F3906|nr:Na+/H+ antiporter [Heyndrickxia oleronia]MBU5213371.1 Na+/H+ antiporter [Heyndrickxia oleronia]
MEMFLIVLLLLAIIGLSNIVNHLIPFIPVPLIQIALGILVAILPFGIHVPMETELFLVLFIAPLLFNDGRHVSRKALWRLRTQILLLALGLVFVTVFAIGFLIHWMIPSIPLPAAFALAAILSPTDVVAVSAMSSRVRMPKTVMHVLEGEGLMNDASGLVAFNFAVAATVTGVFSLANASVSFLVIAIGGFVGGALLAIIIIRFRVLIRRFGMEDVTIHMLIQILTPFIIYLVTEHFHLSGILAVVAAGIVHAIEKDREKSPTVELQIVSNSTWTVILYILNGLVFVLLGLQIPSVGNEIFKDPLFNNIIVIKYILIITAALLLLRFIWIYFSSLVGWKLKKRKIRKIDLNQIGITTISGVRGAVTLAGSFSIPYFLNDGSHFPERSLIIFIAAGVILVTLIIASIFLPVMAKSEIGKREAEREAMEKDALIRSKIAAIRAIREVMNDENRSAAFSIISIYNSKINQLKYTNNEEDSFQARKLEKSIRMKALEAESNYIEKLVKEKQIDRTIAYLSQEYIRRMEIAITNHIKFRALVMWSLIKRSILKLFQLFLPKKQERRKKRRERYTMMLQLKMKMAELAIKVLKEGMTSENRNITYIIIGEYNELLTKLQLVKNADASKKYARMERELQDMAFQAERDEVQKMYEKAHITADVVRKLRQQINIREAYWMEENTLHDA